MFNVKEGWNPLCKFLAVDAPENPFPHENIRASVIDETTQHPVGKIYQKELAASFLWLLLKSTVLVSFVFVAVKFVTRCMF